MDTITLQSDIAIFDKISLRIIREQERIIGPVAWDEARKVQGIHVVDQQKGDVTIDGDAKQILNNLVAQYARLFGKASNELCKEVSQDLLAELPPEAIPSSLK